MLMCNCLRHYHLWQLCSGVDETAVGTSSELIFAPIDASFSDDAPIVPSGFRIIPLEAGMVSVMYSLYCFYVAVYITKVHYLNFHRCTRK